MDEKNKLKTELQNGKLLKTQFKIFVKKMFNFVLLCFDYVSVSSHEDEFDDIQDDELQSSLQAATSLWDSMSPSTHPVFIVPNHSNTMQHLLHGTIHIIKDKGTLLCGRPITVNYTFTCAEDVVCWPMCEQCKLILALNNRNES